MNWDRVNEFVFEKVSKTGIPGLSIAVVEGEEIVWSKGYGYRDLGKLLPATPETFFGIGSITKSFTCLAIMRLVEDGKLSLEDDVSDYVPLDVEGVKIWHLMSHSSGIPALGYAEAMIRYAAGLSKSWFPISKPEHILDFMSDLKDWFLFEPGSRWLYLNEGYEILALIVEKVTGERFREFVKRSVLRPLGLRCAYLDELAGNGNLAKPYIVRDGKIEESRLPLGTMDAAGGLACSALDLARYTSFYIKNGMSVFSENSISEMEKPRVDLPYEGSYMEKYGLGLRITEGFFGRKVLGHGGSVLVYTAHFLYSREDGVGVAVLSNTTGYPMSYMAWYTLAHVLGEDPNELPFLKLERALERYEGRYFSYKRSMEVEVKRSGDFLILKPTNSLSEPAILVPEDPENGIFYTLDGAKKLRVEFFESNGKTHLLFERYLFSREG